MPTMRFNHMELTLPTGTLDTQLRGDITRFYGEVLGWTTFDVPLLGQVTYYLSPDDGQFILVAESDKPMQSPGFDHLGLLVETREEVDALLEQCKAFQRPDDRMKIKEYEDLRQEPVTVHALLRQVSVAHLFRYPVPDLGCRYGAVEAVDLRLLDCSTSFR